MENCKLKTTFRLLLLAGIGVALYVGWEMIKSFFSLIFVEHSDTTAIISLLTIILSFYLCVKWDMDDSVALFIILIALLIFVVAGAFSLKGEPPDYLFECF